MLLVLVMCLGMLPGTALAMDGPTEVTGVETGDGKLKMHVTRKANRAAGQEDAAEPQPQDWVVPLDLSGDDDGRTAYARIGRQAQDFISCVQTMEGALNEIYDMLQRINALTTKASNGTNADIDVEAILEEIAQLRDEIVRVAEDTSFDGWYGLMGGSMWFQSVWESDSVGKLLYCGMEDMRSVALALEALDGLIHGGDNSAADLVSGQIDRVFMQRAELGACQNMAEHIIAWADRCDENMVANYPLTGLEVGGLTGLGEADHAFSATDQNRILTTTRNNALKAIAAIQLYEGALCEIHDSLQRQNELAVQAINGKYTDLDISMIRTEVDRLNLGIRYILAATCIDGYHMMDRDGVLTVPVGWSELCHSKAEIKFTDFEDMLVDPAKFGDRDAAAPDAVKEVIHAVSAQRSEFGTWQNGMEHVVSFCDYVLDNGPMVGNKFGEKDGHHTLDNIEGAFKAEVALILARQDELRVQIGNDTLTGFDRQSIQLELNRLDDVLDILVDLVYVRTAGVVQVQEKGDADWHRDLTLDETGAYYNYKLRYASQHTDVTNVSVVDYLENGDNSVYAGVLTGIELPTDIDPKEIEIYVMLDAIDFTAHEGYGHTTLPDGNWTRIDPGTFTDWDRVYGVGVYFGDTVFGPELGKGRIGADVILRMKLSLGAKANSVVRAMPAGGYVLRNSVMTCENSADAAGAVRTASETYTTVTQPPTEANAVSVGSYVTNQVWTDPDTPPTGPEDSPNWGTDCDAPIGSEVWYRTVIDFGGVTAENVPLAGRGLSQATQNAQDARLRNLVLSQLLDRVTPDYDSMRVWQGGTELAAGKDYRLFTSDFHMYSDDFDPAHAPDVSSLMALRNRIQHTWCPYYTFGMIFSNDLIPGIPATVTWYDEDGTTVLDGKAFRVGDPEPATAIVPIKAEDADNTYTFDGWVKMADSTEDDIKYMATYVAHPKLPVVTPHYEWNVVKTVEAFQNEDGDDIKRWNILVENRSNVPVYNLMLVDTMDKTLDFVDEMCDVDVQVMGNGENTGITFVGTWSAKEPVRDGSDRIVWSNVGGVTRKANGEEKWDSTWMLYGEFKPGAKIMFTYDAKVVRSKARDFVSGDKLYMNYIDVVAGTEPTDMPFCDNPNFVSKSRSVMGGEAGTYASSGSVGRAGDMSYAKGRMASGFEDDRIVIVYKARVDTNAFLTGDDGAGHSIEANGMPVRFVTQANVATLGCSAMDETMFDALVAGSGDDLLPRFAGAEDVDVDAIEAAGSISGSVYRTVSVSSSSALVHNYGFDIAKLDEANKLLQGGTFEVRSDPDDKASAIEFVRVDWMDGSNSEDLYPEGPVYRLAVDSDPQDARTTEIEAGKAILVGLDSGMYYVAEKKSPAGYIRDYAVHSVELLSLSETVSEIRQAAQSMLAQANQANQSVLDDGGTSSGVSRGSGIRVERAGDDAAPDLFVRRCYQAWANLIPISVDGEGYDLSEFGWKQKCVPGIALFDRNEDGEYVYGSSSAVLQIGDRVGMELRGTPENPLKGGIPVVNEPGSEFALPKTGGVGTVPYIMIGSMTALLAALLLADRKKRR